MWKVLAWCSAESSPLLMARYCFADVHRILHRHTKLTFLPSIQAAVDYAPDQDGGCHMLNTLEDHCLEGDKSISISAVLPNSHEFRGQSTHEYPPYYPPRRIVVPYRHDRQCLSPHLTNTIVVYLPLRYNPLLECTQSLYTAWVCQSSPVCM